MSQAEQMSDTSLEQYLQQMSALKQILEAVRALKPADGLLPHGHANALGMATSRAESANARLRDAEENLASRIETCVLLNAEVERLQKVVAELSNELSRFRKREVEVQTLVELAIQLRLPNDSDSDVLYDAAVAVREFQVPNG
jgi:hypothetical protein